MAGENFALKKIGEILCPAKLLQQVTSCFTAAAAAGEYCGLKYPSGTPRFLPTRSGFRGCGLICARGVSGWGGGGGMWGTGCCLRWGLPHGGGGYEPRKRVCVPKRGLLFLLSIQNFMFAERNVLLRSGVGGSQEGPFTPLPPGRWGILGKPWKRALQNRFACFADGISHRFRKAYAYPPRPQRHFGALDQKLRKP